ncbi:SLATT domain-containing protein [Brucella sp. 21LCYQ03]|nr:SLATT domain-containing protein [Brucella sp. 21LCYQ03]
MSETVQDFLRSLKVTAGSRFNAAKRMEHVDQRMTVLSSFSSAYLILVSVVPAIISVTAPAQSILTLFSISLSVVLLASSVSSYARAYGVKAEQYHRSALEIQELRRELRFIGENVAKEDFERLSHRYNAILQKYSLNHSDVDFYRYQLEYKTDYQLGRLDRLIKRLQVSLAYSYPTIAITIITIAVFLFLFIAAKYEGDFAKFLREFLG